MQNPSRFYLPKRWIDAARFAALAQRPDVAARVERIRRDAGGRQIVLGIDRLDYTKGIPRRLHAVERLLEREPNLRDTIRYVQVAVPSRGDVDSYQRFKRQVEESVGRINGACGTLGSTPVHYVHRSVSLKELVALYCAADVMLVTPLRDGMNLVAKEFVASRVDEDGVLILSEFAGAAAELDGAVSVNPYDVDAVADSIRLSLSMPIGERRARMRTLRCRVSKHNVNVWAGSFLDRLQAARSFDGVRRSAQPSPPVAAALAGVCHATPLRLLLDYDGTLVPLARSPELAAPDDELLLLLSALGSAPGIELTIVSGRTVDTLEAWLGELPVSLSAEHGFWYRASPRASWQPAMDIDVGWMKKVLPILKQFTASTPGSHLEIKTASIAWHFRRAQREFGARQAHELRMLLGDALSNQPLEVLEGKKVIEVRLRGVNKALVTRGLQIAVGPGSPVVAIGDDRTDEDLFRALPPSSLTIAVGRQLTCAKHRVADHRDVREILRSLLTARGITVPSGGRPRLRAVIPA